MTTGCSKECAMYNDICDFCQYFEFRGRGYMKNGVIWRDVIYTEDGWCIFHQQKKRPEESCNKFYCSNLSPLKANKNWKTQPWMKKKYKEACKKEKYNTKVVKTTIKEKQ